METNISEWVNDAPSNRSHFRQAVHLILHAIGSDEYLSRNMIMKGGMLLGLRYQSSRYTDDIDFSTALKLRDIDQDVFVRQLVDALVIAEDDISYSVTCRLQSIKLMPKKDAENKTFPAFKIQIAYADKQDSRAMKRLLNGDSLTTVKIDYSLNEESYEIETLVLDGEEEIQAYALTDLLAEKLRSLIQQVTKREEPQPRKQDIYDVWYLLTHCDDLSLPEKGLVLNSLKQKSIGRIDPDIINKQTLSRDDIRAVSKIGYDTIGDEVLGELPEFKEAYATIQNFYESLPW
jgi:predicted nucleotidyltransferase component of viral defense system